MFEQCPQHSNNVRNTATMSATQQQCPRHNNNVRDTTTMSATQQQCPQHNNNVRNTATMSATQQQWVATHCCCVADKVCEIGNDLF